MLRRLVLIVAVVAAGHRRARRRRLGGRRRTGVNVVTTVSPITNIVQNVGGRPRRVTGIVPEGTNSHTFEPAPSDAARDGRGRHRLHQRAPPRGADPRARRGERPRRGADRAARRRDDHAPTSTSSTSRSRSRTGDPNPHLWTNPLVREAVRGDRRRSELSKLDPDNAAGYEANFEAFAARIDELDAARARGDRDRAAARTASSSPTTTRSRTSRASTGGRSSARSSRPTSPSRPPQEVAALIDQIRERAGAGDLRLGGLPEPRARADRRRDRRGPTSTTCATTTSPARTAIRITATSASWSFDFRTFMGALGGDAIAVRRPRRHEHPAEDTTTGTGVTVVTELIRLEKVTCRYGQRAGARRTSTCRSTEGDFIGVVGPERSRARPRCSGRSPASIRADRRPRRPRSRRTASATSRRSRPSTGTSRSRCARPC